MAGGIFIPRKEETMILKVQRKPTEAGVELQFNYDNPGLEFLVKNFSNGDIYVGFEPGGGKSSMPLIPSETAQIISSMTVQGCSTVYVVPDETSDKGVEVQCLRW